MKKWLYGIMGMLLGISITLAALYFIPKTTNVDLTLDAVKLDLSGNEIGAARITVTGKKLDYLFQKDRLLVQISPLEGLPEATNRNIDDRVIYHEGYCYVHLFATDPAQPEVLPAVVLAFSEDLDRWAVRVNTGAGDPAVCYVSSVSGTYSVKALTQFFHPLVPAP